MSVTRTSQIVPLVPTADHSAKEGYFVVLSGTSAALVSSATATAPYGVITDGAETTGFDAVALPGFDGLVSVMVGSTPGTIVKGTKLQIKADGSVIADAGTGARILVAIAEEAGIADELTQARLIEPVVIGNAVTITSTNGEIGGLTISGAYSQAEVTALRDKCEEASDDIRAIYAALPDSDCQTLNPIHKTPCLPMHLA
jgi:hypothetical protein